tara:strand:+ start:2410 stop:2769 length:360 start_codon:yes stop_codon:yes gene_type:complete
MLKIYCQKCGGLNAYVSEKPKFCQKCGNNFASIGAPKKLESQARALVEESDDMEIFNIPDIDGLLVDIEIAGPSSSKVGDIAGTNEEGLKLDRGQLTPEQKALDPIEELKREGSSLRQK